MIRAEKVKRAEELKEVFAKAKGVFVTDYRGIDVASLVEFRKELNKIDAKFTIVKNRMAVRVLTEDQKGIEEHFDYTTAVTFSFGDVAASAKALTNFSKGHQQIKLKAGWVEGKVVSIADINALATLPSREELLASLLGTLNNVPGGFVRVLNAVPSKFVYLLTAIKEKKEEGGA